MRSVVRRRSPRGNSSTRSCRADAIAARKRAWSASTRAARNGSTPLVARRSVSGSSESSRTRAGKVPSARPHRNTRSRSRPRPEAHVTHEDPVTQATHPAEVVVELEGEGATEHVEARRALDRVEPGEALERRIDLVGGLLLRLGPRVAHGDGRDVVGDQAVRPRDELAPRGTRGRAAREVVLQRTHEALEVARRRAARARTTRDEDHGRGPRAPRRAGARARGRGVRAARPSACRHGRCRSDG